MNAHASGSHQRETCPGDNALAKLAVETSPWMLARNLGGLLERQAEAMLERMPSSAALSERVRALLASESELREVSLPQTARHFGMSVRTFTRRLSEEGAHFGELLAQIRKAEALRELEKGSRPIAEIAARLGFASTPSFHRAFRRWTGTTAEQIRREARAQHVSRA